ncbi:MAG: hypothetical protein GF364_14965 [Candidatus Lokiarchaeota archaeon]|nr:hypothetical protein [Candidatus Lokiarchaeota archaeon]
MVLKRSGGRRNTARYTDLSVPMSKYSERGSVWLVGGNGWRYAVVAT